MTLNPAVTRILATALLLMAVVILLDQATILLTSVYPANTGTVSWRFGVVGLTIGRVTPVLFGDALILAAALLAGWVGLLRALGVLHILAAVVLLGGVGFFALDAVEIRAQMALAQRTGLALGAARTILVGAVAGLLCLWLGVRLLLVRPDGERSRGSGMLVVGSGAPGEEG